VQHIDSNSHANFNEIVTEHVHFDALVNFEEQVVTGTQTLTLRVLRDTIKYIDLDVWNLKIFRVVDGHFKVMHFELLQEFDSDVLGEKLRIHLPF
jgi:leukotriene-A4 hydrolase